MDRRDGWVFHRYDEHFEGIAFWHTQLVLYSRSESNELKSIFKAFYHDDGAQNCDGHKMMKSLLCLARDVYTFITMEQKGVLRVIEFL